MRALCVKPLCTDHPDFVFFVLTLWALTTDGRTCILQTFQGEGTPFPVALFRSAVSRYYLFRSWTILGQTFFGRPIPGSGRFPVGPFPAADISRSWTKFGQLFHSIFSTCVRFLALQVIFNRKLFQMTSVKFFCNHFVLFLSFMSCPRDFYKLCHVQEIFLSPMPCPRTLFEPHDMSKKFF